MPQVRGKPCRIKDAVIRQGKRFITLPGVRIELSATGHHFLMWDDPQWLRGQVQAFLDSHR